MSDDHVLSQMDLYFFYELCLFLHYACNVLYSCICLDNDNDAK